ncbi:MAG TPA: SRPBCC domain-containing protein [Candidatus Dormibacteraeota bacterium]|nr:SRPBCC domain-containing protein [Candidatus Dormibacteraeota bacterium]
MEAVFKALSDVSRRKLLDRLFERDGQTLTELCDSLPAMTRFGVMKHLGLLEDAGLVTTRRIGRQKVHYLNAVPIRLIHDRWIGKYRRARAAALAELKLDMEEEMIKTDNRPAQIYTVYIRAPKEKVFDAITRPEFTHRYFFGSEPTSTWKAGDRLLWTEHGSGRALVDGEVIEFDPPRRLVHSWIVKYDDTLTAEGPSRVTWELEETDGVTKVTAIHDDFPMGSKVYENVAGGWPLVLSGLKTLVETGAPLQPEKVSA